MFSLPKTVLTSLILLLTFTVSAHAQNFSMGIAQYYPVEGDVHEGDIIAVRDGKYVKTAFRYQPDIVGIYVETPALEFRPESTEGLKAVLNTGEVYVNVSSINGPIVKNDFLTSSEVPGVAMFADRGGFVIGTAMEDYSETDTSKVAKIKVNVYVQDTSSSAFTLNNQTAVNLLDVFSASKLALYESPSESFKYIVASVVVLISFIFGFITFRKVAVKGVEAIGRNPLASKVIGFGILLNLVITVSIIIAGLILAYFIVTL